MSLFLYIFVEAIHPSPQLTMKTYTIAQVAEMLDLTQKAVRRLIAGNSLEASKSGTRYAISDAAVRRYRRNLHKSAVQPSLFDAPKRMSVKAPKMPEGEVNWIDISESWNAVEPSAMTFVDLFCGAGGLSKGLEMAGLEGICGLDFFKEACMTYERNFDHPFVNGDIKRPENKRRFYDEVARRLAGRHLSVVAGGFPCQGFSMAGNRIVDDPRNSLYLELVAIVKHLQPDFVVCENVKGLRSMLGGKVERKIIDDFRAIGYEMNVAVLCAADYFTPQKRERVIFIGNRLGLKNYHPKPMLEPADYVTTGSAIADLMDRPDDPAFNHVATRHRPDMARRMLELEEGKSLYKGYSDAWKKCPWNEASCTIKENHGGVNVHPKLPRVLTAREMARLQSFPDDFIFEGTKNKQLVQIGNAVPPLLGKAIGLALRYSNNDLRI